MRMLAPILLFAAAAAPAQVFRAGAYSVDVTPRTFPIITSGGFLAATAERAVGTLHIRALALDDGRTRAVIVVADTLMIPRELADRAKRTASERTGVPVIRMLISATHTHSAPPLMGALGTDENPEYARLFEERLVEAIEGAVERLRPARIGWTVVNDSEHTHCRRWILRSDKMRRDPFGDLTVRAHMHPGYQNPDFVGPSGPVDPDLSILAFQTPEGRPLALLANYSMHYVGAGGKVVSPDYYGPFVENMERAVGGMAMMSQGTSGDQHWMDYSRPRKDMNPQMYAGALAAIAHEAYRAIKYRNWAPLDMRETVLRLSRRLPDDRRLAWAAEMAAQMGGARPRNQQEVYAREQLLIHGAPVRELVLQAMRIGDLGITAIPNEVFAITGLKLKAQSPLAHTINIELANGAEGYIPPPEQHKLGGYTTWPARTAGLEVQAEPKIVNALLGLLEQVARKPRKRVVDAHGPYAKSVLASQPVAYWRANEFTGPAALDATGLGNAAQYEDGIAFYLEGPELTAQKTNRAPHFAGGRLRASLKALPETYSLEMWVYNGFPASVRPVTGYLFERAGDQLGIDGNGRLFFASGGSTLHGSEEIPLRTWRHVVLVRGKTSIAVYLNGRPEIAGNAPASGAASPDIFVGGRADGATNFEGRIDEIAVFARQLSAREIAARSGAR